MLEERGVNVDYTTLYLGAQKYMPEMEKCLRWGTGSLNGLLHGRLIKPTSVSKGAGCIFIEPSWIQVKPWISIYQ